MPTRIEDEPESTVGKKPARGMHPERPDAGRERQPPPERGATRSGAAIRREEGDESEFAGEIREREKNEPMPEPDEE